jgi:multidrug efflux pump subunit AcrB
MNVARFALRNDKVLFFVTIVLALLGLRAYTQTPQSIFPTMSFSKIDVVVDAGDLPPDRVRVAIALPLETAFQSLTNVMRVRANSSQGTAELIVEFEPSTDPHVDLTAVNEAISETRSSLDGAKAITAVIVNPNSEPVLSYAMTSPSLSQAVMRDIALHAIVPKLFGITGLGRILVTGGPTTEFHVQLDPAALAQHGLGAADVVKAISDANAVQAVGAHQQYYQKYAIVIDAALKDIASLETIGVPDKNGSIVPLSALGSITLGVSPVTDQASYDAQHAVVINAYPVAGADTVTMAREFRNRLAGIATALPREIAIHNFWDQTTLVVESQRSLRDAILLGALLAIVVIFLFLRNVRLTIVAAAVIPIAMAIAIFALQLAGQTLNLMSVGGLAVAVGLIIDDAIVVIENIARNIRERPELSKTEAIALAMSQLAPAMTASTATTVVVFLPLGLLSGVTGYFFRALAFTLSASLLVSLALALFIAPNIARVLYRESAHDEHDEGVIARILERYDGVLRWALGHRVALYAGAAVVLVATVGMLSILPNDFLPKMDEGQFEVGYVLPTGTTLEATDAASLQMEKIVAADPAVAAVGRLTGIDSNGYSPTPQNKGLLRVALVPEGRRASYDEISARLRVELQRAIPSATFDFHQILEDLINDLSGTPAPIEIAIRGNDQATLIALAGKLADKLGSVHGIVDASSGIVYDSPTLRLVPRYAQLAALGLTPSDVGDAVSAISLGTVATSVSGETAQIPVRVTVAQQTASTDLASSSLYAKGGATSLGDLARIAPVTLASDENDENGTRVIRVTANIAGANLSSVIAGIKKVLRADPPPPGYTAEIGGQYTTQQASFREFVAVIAIAIALVFSVMLATFRSYRLPLVILTAIPLALIGVALGLFVTKTPFNVSSFMGLLLLVGIVVKNGILLIDVANEARAHGDRVEDALVLAGRTRLRPIVMTTLAAIGGLLPLAFGIGQGSEMEKPLAIAVIGGLSTATIFTLVAIPVLYASFVGDAKPKTEISY